MPPKVGKAPDVRGKDGKKGDKKLLDPNSPEVLLMIAQRKLEHEKQNLAVELAFEKDRFRQETEIKMKFENDLSHLKTRLAKTAADSDDILTHKQREIKLKMDRVKSLDAVVKELEASLSESSAEVQRLLKQEDYNKKRLADAAQLLQDKATLEDVVRQQDVVITKQEDEILRQSEMLDDKEELLLKDKLVIEELSMKAGTNSKLRLVFGDPWMLTHTRHKLRGTVPLDRDGNTLTSMGAAKVVLYGGQPENDDDPDGLLTVLDLDRMVWETAGNLNLDPLKEIKSLEAESFDHLPRWGHSACALSKKKMAVIGGRTDHGLETDVNVLNIDSMKWRTPHTKGHLHRCEHPATAVIRDRVYVFGGMVNNVCINDLADLDFDKMRWHAIRPLNGVLPPPRGYHSMNPCSYGQRLWVFGGHDGVRSLGDLWTFEFATSVWTVPITTGLPPTARHSHAATIIEGFMVIAGGIDDSYRRMRDIHLLNLQTLEWEMLEDGEAYALPAETATSLKPAAVYSAFHGHKLVTLRPNKEEGLDELEVLELSQPENLEDLRMQRKIVAEADKEEFEITDAVTFPTAMEVSWRAPARLTQRIARYKLLMANSTGVVKEVCQGKYERFKVTGLAQSTEYVFCVKAIFDDGSHMWSLSRSFVTKVQHKPTGLSHRTTSAPPHGHSQGPGSTLV